MKKIILSLFFFLLCSVAFSQSAVYFCPQTGIIGYSQDNESCVYWAELNCRNAGGTTPYQLMYAPVDSYCAIVVGYDYYGTLYVGAGYSYSSKQEAVDVAQAKLNSAYAIYNQYIFKSW